MTGVPETTADAVVGVVEAVVAGRDVADLSMVASFVDLPAASAQAALQLAADLGLVTSSGDKYQAASPLARLFVTPRLEQKAAILRVAVEAYEPFRVFRERLHATDGAVSTAAEQTKALLGLAEHREKIKETLVSLGTYCQSLVSAGGGAYEVRFDFNAGLVSNLAGVVAELAEAELRVRDWLDERARAYVDQREVLEPLAEAYLKVSQGDSRGATVGAGNAVESFLVQLANDLGVNVVGANGIGAKLDRFQQVTRLPKKLIAVGKYLSNVRNAADHGIDSEVGKAWTIRDGTGEDFLRVSVTFIGAAVAVREGLDPEI